MAAVMPFEGGTSGEVKMIASALPFVFTIAQSASRRAASQNGTLTYAVTRSFTAFPGPVGGAVFCWSFWKSWVTTIGMPAAFAFFIAGTISESAVPWARTMTSACWEIAWLMPAVHSFGVP